MKISSKKFSPPPSTDHADGEFIGFNLAPTVGSFFFFFLVIHRQGDPSTAKTEKNVLYLFTFSKKCANLK